MTLVFHNGPVFVAGAKRRWARAVAVSDGRIVAVGTDADVRAVVGRDVEPIDLAGRMLAPGFQDAHVHPVMGGLTRLRCNLEDATDLAEALSTIRRYVHDHPDSEWIVGGGWNYPWFEGGNPSASLLDEITDKPVHLVGADGHSSWVNSTALRMARIDAESPDPSDGRIERLPDGSPMGTLHEGAMQLVEDIAPSESIGDIVAGLLEGQRYLHSVGVTAWQDAWIEPGVHQAYKRTASSGDLVSLVRGALWWDRERGIEQLEELLKASTESIGTYFPRTIKLMLDGVCENHTAAMLSPYLDAKGAVTDNAGIDFIGRGSLDEIVAAIDAAGLQVHFHALGDRAVRNALDAIEFARQRNGWTDLRPHLAHLQVIDPHDIPRFRHLGAVANIQPLWAVADAAMTDLTIPFLGEERTRHQYPFKSLIDAGATLAAGSDWPVSTPDVMQQIHVAVNRQSPGHESAEVFLPDQRIGLADALVAFTAGAAHVNHFDAATGTIQQGARADLVLLSGNPFDGEHVAGIEVDMTVVGGEVVYQRGHKE